MVMNLIPPALEVMRGGVQPQEIPQYLRSVSQIALGVAVAGFVGLMTRAVADRFARETGTPTFSHLLAETPPVIASTEIFTRAKRYFGTTTSPDEAGYILPDGTMLDFSGKKLGGTPGERMLDHRDIAFAWPEEKAVGGFEAMRPVMNWGAIRSSVCRDMVIVNLVKLPTDAQIGRINSVLDYYSDAVLVVEVDNAELAQIDYQDFH
jgi:hypothetical protein